MEDEYRWEMNIEEDSSPGKKSSIWWKVLLLFAGIYVAIAIIVYYLQNMILYHPEIYSPVELAAWVKLDKLGKLDYWPAPGEYRGLVSKVKPAVQRGTVIVLHGNAGSVIDRAFYVDKIEPLGYRVILYEYPGYGARKGKMDEENIVRDAVQTVLRAEKEFERPIYLIGESLGAGVASAVAREIPDRIDGILLITPWDSLRSLVQPKFWLLPADLIMNDRYDSLVNLEKYTGPVGIVMAGNDEIISNDSTQRLYLSVQKKHGHLWEIPNAGHNTWVLFVDASFWERIFFFLEKKVIPEGKSNE